MKGEKRREGKEGEGGRGKNRREDKGKGNEGGRREEKRREGKEEMRGKRLGCERREKEREEKKSRGDRERKAGRGSESETKRMIKEGIERIKLMEGRKRKGKAMYGWRKASGEGKEREGDTEEAEEWKKRSTTM